ncbi:Ubiquitin conjugation factor E4 B [Coemansia sp. RSA 2336]|nr:Ubiquitin conjugation factor E4 B [Coemansia sp. RSA 2336]
MNSRGYKWEFIGKLEWADSRPMGLCNQELSPRAVEQFAGAKGSVCRDMGRWFPINKPLHFVTQIKVRILAMHQSVALGIGGLEIWGQPSQRLPRHLKEQAWLNIRQHSQISPNPYTVQINNAYTEPAEASCPPEFIDSITQNIMSDPVILPSQNTCDRSTIIRHLAEHATDPFTGLPLAMEQLKPNLALQLRIRNWQQK